LAAPSLPITPTDLVRPTQQNERAKRPRPARHARGRTRLPALLVVLRWRRGGGGLPSVWYQSAPPPRARRWRTGGLQVRGLRPAPWRRVHRYVRAPSRRRNEQPKSTASPTTRPRLAVDGVCVRLSARPYTRERRCIWLGAWRVAQVAAKLLDHRRSGALDLRPPEPTGALPPEHTPLSAWPHITARSSVTRDGAQYLRLFTW
jgi:hypothetical protein